MKELPVVRRAFVGLSSPLAYDYSNPASRAQADAVSSPNPILDSPFGLMLLFDELVFLTRSLCPDNMRDPPFVRFLDEEGFTAPAGLLDLAQSYKALESDPKWGGLRSRAEIVQRPDDRAAIQAAGAIWRGVDNHSHGLHVGELKAMGNATVHNVILDFMLLEHIGNGYELVTNSFTQPLLEPEASALPQAHLTELLVVKNIPNYLSAEGPYHPIVDEARANSHLAAFRKWMAQSHAHISKAEVADVRDAVERSIQEMQDELFLKHLSPRRKYLSIGKAVIGEGLGALVPGAGLAAAVVDEAVAEHQVREQRWAGFVVAMRSHGRG